MLSAYILAAAMLTGTLSAGEPPEHKVVADSKQAIASEEKVSFQPKAPRKSEVSLLYTPKVEPDGVWDRLAACESGGRWDYNGSSGFDGGLQFLPSTWNSMNTGYAYAWQAPREVQIDAGKRLQARSGWGQWPSCSSKLGLL